MQWASTATRKTENDILNYIEQRIDRNAALPVYDNEPTATQKVYLCYEFLDNTFVRIKLFYSCNTNSDGINIKLAFENLQPTSNDLCIEQDNVYSDNSHYSWVSLIANNWIKTTSANHSVCLAEVTCNLENGDKKVSMEIDNPLDFKLINYHDSDNKLSINSTRSILINSSDKANTIIEKSGAGQIIYTATVNISDSVTYFIEEKNGEDFSSFTIDSTTGNVTLTENPDNGNQPSYSFTIIAMDTEGNVSKPKNVKLDIASAIF